MDSLVRQGLMTTDELAARIGAPGMVVVDASWHLPAAGRNAHAEYLDAHLPGALFFDIEETSDSCSHLPHMLPGGERFAKAVSQLGIDNDSFVAVYDTHGLMSAARVWWMFRVYGHDAVAILDGGAPKWRREGRPMERGPVQAVSRRYAARFRPDLVRSRADMLANLDTEAFVVVDARPAERFFGNQPEPRPGVRRGHIPRSRNLPYDRLLDAREGILLDADGLRAAFAEAGLDGDEPIVATCGSGVTACVLAFGLFRLGRSDVAVYDGAWAEWGADSALPAEKL